MAPFATRFRARLPTPSRTNEGVRRHQDHTAPPDEAIFVFGSNLGGRHGRGAALWARQNRQIGSGAQHSIGWLKSGRNVADCYAIATKDAQLHPLPLHAIEIQARVFLQVARNRPADTFFLTRVGCGLAANTDEDVAWMFANTSPNVSVPEPWADLLPAVRQRNLLAKKHAFEDRVLASAIERGLSISPFDWGLNTRNQQADSVALLLSAAHLFAADYLSSNLTAAQAFVIALQQSFPASVQADSQGCKEYGQEFLLSATSGTCVASRPRFRLT